MNEPQPSEEIWIFGGNRIDNHGKRIHAWTPIDANGNLSDDELWFKPRGSHIPGSQYRVQVVRYPEGKVTKYGDGTYHQRHPDDAIRAKFEAAHRAAETRLRLAALERNDKRQSALDTALQPLIDLLTNASPADREALITYVLRRLLVTRRY
jgi:hypothetical protein